MLNIKDECDVKIAVYEINEFLEENGSALYVAIVPRDFADALNKWYRKESGESII